MISNEDIFAAATRVLAERPDATLQTIAQAAGISRTTIFYRFPTRESLLQALSVDAFMRIKTVMSVLTGETSSQYPQKLLEVTQKLIPLVEQSMFLRNVPTENNNLNSVWAEATAPLTSYLIQLQQVGILSKEIPHRWLVASYISLLFAAWDEVSLGELGSLQASRLVVHTWLRGAGHISI
jgi:AcrR family transcriptional regulator